MKTTILLAHFALSTAQASATPSYRCADETGRSVEVVVKGDEARVVAEGAPEQVLVRDSPKDAFRKAVPRERCWDDGCERWNDEHRFAVREDGTATLALDQFSICKAK